MTPGFRRIALCTVCFGFIAGATFALALAADSAPKTKNCGGAPAAEGGARTNNANCKKCVKGCKFADSGYKICQDDGTGCTYEAFPTFKQCDGELWTKTDCTGTMSGACQAARKICK